jgi:hypothetical protein
MYCLITAAVAVAVAAAAAARSSKLWASYADLEESHVYPDPTHMYALLYRCCCCRQVEQAVGVLC